MTKEEILNSVWSVRCSAASNPNTPIEALVELAKDSVCDVRCSAASNPNTPIEALVELAKDSVWSVRWRAASNPNTPGYIENREYTITKTYVATQGTANLWYRHKGITIDFYTCGCFVGSREQLIGKINFDGGSQLQERMMILELLDKKFNEVFNNKN